MSKASYSYRGPITDTFVNEFGKAEIGICLSNDGEDTSNALPRFLHAMFFGQAKRKEYSVPAPLCMCAGITHFYLTRET